MMTMIDWSDPDEMLGLLIEFVADEIGESHPDRDRARFLDELSQALVATADQQHETAGQMEVALCSVLEEQSPEFAGDPVMGHLEACISELQRIAADSSPESGAVNRGLRNVNE